jgi:hypothetical protein
VIGGGGPGEFWTCLFFADSNRVDEKDANERTWEREEGGAGSDSDGSGHRIGTLDLEVVARILMWLTLKALTKDIVLKPRRQGMT